ncbi:spore germination protein [Paenibacillus glycanilyticus]|uniref:spore germination protein n=1 Tax=Paenibacillus glycanilyticus TaxID=126569 RepID=UPI002040F1A2|nr:spore germination protein [Paenibacillus glycanilyticus]MCM3626649.1 spore germination protein [Paenibacillus glycanilyticus]
MSNLTNERSEKKLITGHIQADVSAIHAYLSNTEDFKTQSLATNIGACTLVYLESLAKKEFIQSHIILTLIDTEPSTIESLATASGAKSSSELYVIGQALLEGYCVVLFENHAKAYLITAAQTHSRSIDEPSNEQIIKGSHEGFVESLSTNLYLLRYRIKSPQLKVKYLSLGTLTNTTVAMVYMEKLADPNIVKECEKRLQSIHLEHLYSTGEIDEMIEEHPLSPFPQTLHTERTDRAVSYLMEGKINILVDGNPMALVLPITFFSFYQSPDDYNNRWITGSFYRLVRMISFMLAISLPAIYIAIVSFHSEVLPPGILYSVKVSLTYVPFPPIVEAIAMQLILELLKEAAIRLPSPIAQTIGIVGGLVIGTAVVEAHLVSHTMIVVIGLTAIASFTAPLNEFGTSLRILGFPTMIAAALFGFFGISMMMMVIFIHLCKIETLGVPFFAPFGPFRGRDGKKDIFLRLPVWKTGKAGNKQSFIQRWKLP